MNYNIVPTVKFKREAKRLVKKYPSLINELAEVNNQLMQNPTTGTPLGNDTYKIRVGIKSKGKGKSGGARVITYVVSGNMEIYLLTIYDKSEFDAVDDRLLKQEIKNLDISK
jgi:mRNA-degrading endonuclease RelE of RelBE toxin-antitoxin system